MIEIKPFPAVSYNYKNKACQPRKVICPPYDIISPAQAKLFRSLSPYNMVNLILPEDSRQRSKYKTAALRFRNYLKKGILCQDREPAIYFYEQKFNNGRSKRLGFICCLGLSDKPSIHGHEHTHIEPKEDRLKLLVNVRANLEPIFLLFSDHTGFLREAFGKSIGSRKPLINFRDRENNVNSLWRLTDQGMLKRLRRIMRKKNIFIADGHHRYEVSLNYRQQMRKRSGRHFRDSKDFNYIMAYFCPIQSPGLLIKPVHRLVKGIKSLPLDKFAEFFKIRQTSRAELSKLIQSHTSNQRMLGAYFNNYFYIFTLKNRQFLAKIDKHYRSLDIALLNQLILKRVLGINPGNKQRVVFGADAQELIRMADADKASAVFFVQPVRISSLISLARAGRKMPPKTTYFYPKVPSGLVIYKFNG
ncbi:DUF1015 domain-containing protein [Candidatus Omnitrophota bacterium]